MSTEEEALSHLARIRTLHPMARHHVHAFVLGCESTATQRIRYSDDGEPAKTAGLPILETLRHAYITNVICVVTRYFGGTLLGTGGLVRAYTDSTQAALKRANLLELIPCRTVAIQLPYAHYDAFQYALSKLSARITDTQYTHEVTLTIEVPVSEAETFTAWARQTLGPSGIISVGDEHISACPVADKEL